MSLGTEESPSETGDDSLSAIAFDSDFETKAKRKGFHRPPPASPKSPYYSKPRKVASWRSLRTAGTMPLSSRVSLTPQKLWLGSAKQGGGTQPLHSTPTQEHAWTLPPSSTPDHLAEAVRVRRSDLRRSASNGHVPGIAVCREKEDMCDEIIELKKPRLSVSSLVSSRGCFCHGCAEPAGRWPPRMAFPHSGADVLALRVTGRA